MIFFQTFDFLRYFWHKNLLTLLDAVNFHLYCGFHPACCQSTLDWTKQTKKYTILEKPKLIDNCTRGACLIVVNYCVTATKPTSKSNNPQELLQFTTIHP